MQKFAFSSVIASLVISACVGREPVENSDARPSIDISSYLLSCSGKNADRTLGAQITDVYGRKVNGLSIWSLGKLGDGMSKYEVHSGSGKCLLAFKNRNEYSIIRNGVTVDLHRAPAIYDSYGTIPPVPDQFVSYDGVTHYPNFLGERETTRNFIEEFIESCALHNDRTECPKKIFDKIDLTAATVTTSFGTLMFFDDSVYHHGEKISF